MRAMRLEKPGAPLVLAHMAKGAPGPGEILIQVRACGVCRTDLHILDGELAASKLPIVPGHEIIGIVAELGAGVERCKIGDRVGVPWLGFTGYTIDGGYADYAIADQRFCFPIPDRYGDAEAAPLLCAGLIGYRALRMAGVGERLGLYGFGAAAHIAVQGARHQGRRVFAFTRTGDEAG